MTPTGTHRRRTRPTTPRLGLGRAAVLGVVALGLFVAAGCSSGATSTSTTAGSGSSASSAAGGGSMITISNYKFVPATLRVHPGQTITVANHDGVAHTVTSASGHFDTGNIQPGASVTFKAPMSAGSFPYICSIHQFMTGTLTVT